MTVSYDPAFVDDFLAHHWRFRPVDATFMGDKAHDSELPPAGPETLADEIAEIDDLLARLEASEEPESLGDRLDRRMMLAELRMQRLSAETRPRLHNPAWYSGEAAFAVISLLLPQSQPIRHTALIARLNGIGTFLRSATERLDGVPAPQGWVKRAQKEATAMAGFLRSDIQLHEEFADDWAEPARQAADAFDAFAAALDTQPDADPACGEAYLTQLMAGIHGLPMSPREAVDMAEAAYKRMGDEMTEMARAIDPSRTADQILAGLADIHPADPEAVFDSYMDWDVQAVARAPNSSPRRRNMILTIAGWPRASAKSASRSISSFIARRLASIPAPAASIGSPRPARMNRRSSAATTPPWSRPSIRSTTAAWVTTRRTPALAPPNRALPASPAPIARWASLSSAPARSLKAGPAM